MPYKLKAKPSLDKIFEKIGKRDPAQLDAINKKVKQILEDPYRFKPLGAILKNKRRAHIYKSFVLVYEIHENEKIVELWDYDHHDKIYKKTEKGTPDGLHIMTKVVIKSCLEGAKEAEGIAVIIDVFRASNTIIACLGQGAEYIIPVGRLEDAIALKKKYLDYLLLGERKGLPPEGFDYGNSPYETSTLDLKGKKIILTTSSGSQGIINATKASEILIGSFANAKAIINYLKKANQKTVSLVAMGTSAYKKAEEDELCAEYIKQKLLGKKPNFESVKKQLLDCDGANRLRTLKQDDDLRFSLKLDIYNIVPKYDFKQGRIISQTT